jgi:hypothetical protein
MANSHIATRRKFRPPHRGPPLWEREPIRGPGQRSRHTDPYAPTPLPPSRIRLLLPGRSCQLSGIEYIFAVSLILTPAELAALTDCTQSAAQIRWLEAHKWPFVVGNSGRPKVARSFFESTMGPRKVGVPAPSSGIDIAALDAHMHKPSGPHRSTRANARRRQ